MNDSTPPRNTHSKKADLGAAHLETRELERDPWTDDHFFDTISELVMLHSPSGVEDEINEYLLAKFSALGVEHWQDEADNIVVRLAKARQNDTPPSS
ncbi:M42 family peptidase, partial [cf. Phormidesmis sp. LEGE 11477]|nr:M42 family peptidase [cf. Phormidesmis sp. LEGE 11477]